VCDVAKRLKVNFNENSDIGKIEKNILDKVLEDALEKMSPEGQAELLRTVSGKTVLPGKGSATTAVLMAMFRAGGFKSYKLTLIVVNWVWRALFGRGLPFVVNHTLLRYLAIGAGPIGWTLVGLWTMLDIASPAYRITVPGVLYVAMLRLGMEMKGIEDDETKEDAASSDTAGTPPADDAPDKGE